MTQLQIITLANQLAWRIMPALERKPEEVTLSSIKGCLADYEIDSPTRRLTQWEIGRIAGIILRQI